MKKEFWLERWQKGLTGFHSDDVNHYLEKWIEHAQLKKGSTIFVPLCGKSVDLLWLASLQFKVIGVELSPLAIEQLINEYDLKTEVRDMDSFSVYSMRNLHIICGDYFELTAKHLGKVDFVYDRAALIALPHEMRQKYIAHMQTLIPNSVSTLLIALDYPQEQMSGPPFAVSEDEVREYYNKATLLESVDVLQDSKKFSDRGVNSLIENVWYVGGV